MNSVKIYDTSLRDGNQARGISFSLADKLLLARKMDDFGIDYIEGGWPNSSSPIDVEFFKEIKLKPFKNAKVVAFGSTRRPGKPVEEDVLTKSLVESGAQAFTIFGKSWDIHVTDVIRTTLEENIEMIRSTVEYLKKHAEEVFYDAEHFFDGYLANPEYAMKTLQAAKKGGADCIILCDTNGGMADTWKLEEIVSTVKEELGIEVGIHCHNDTGTAVINSMSAVKAGATQIQGVINGFGERCGNANLTTIIPNLALKLGYEIACTPNIADLRSLSLEVDQVANVTPDERQPWVGKSAFAHKGGAHIDGVLKVSHSFEHINPGTIGNQREFVISDQSGGSLIVDKLVKIAPDLDKKNPKVADILRLVKEKEALGYRFDTAEGSFQLLSMKLLGLFDSPIKIDRYRIIEEMTSQGQMVSEASIKAMVGKKQLHRVAEGDGPVNALDNALRLLLRDQFDFMSEVQLENFSVKVSTEEGSASQVRVWAHFVDEQDSWQTAGVSENIITASFEALLDGVNYKIMKEGL